MKTFKLNLDILELRKDQTTYLMKVLVLDQISATTTTGKFLTWEAQTT